MRYSLLLTVACLGTLLAACDDDTGPEPESFSASLTGSAERPNPVTTNASGTATFTVDDGSVDFTINASQLNGAIMAHIHGPASESQTANVLVTLFGAAAPGVNIASGALVSGTFPSATYPLATGVTVDSVLKLMRAGNAYVNVHTVTNQPGEIRGQLERN